MVGCGDRYRVEKIVPCELTSHADFFSRPGFFTLTRIRDSFMFTLKFSRNLGWAVGDVVIIPESDLQNAINQ